MYIPGSGYVKRAYNRVKNNLKNPKALANIPVTYGLSMFLGDDERSDVIQNAIIGAQIAGAAIGGGVALNAGGAAAAGTSAGAAGAAGTSAGLTTTQKILLGGIAGKSLYDLYNNQRNYGISKEYSEGNLELQQNEFEYQKWLNEHGIGQQLAQYQAAGINPIVATAGSQSSAQSMPVSAPQRNNAFDTVFNAGIDLYSLKSELQSRKDIADSQNATNKSIADLNASTSKDINLENIYAREREYKYEQDQISARALADRILQSDKINFDQKKQLLDSIINVQTQNQMNKVEYENKRRDLLNKIVENYQTLDNGKLPSSSGLFSDAWNLANSLSLSLKVKIDEAKTNFKNWYDRVEQAIMGVPKWARKDYFKSQFITFINDNWLPPYQQASISGYEAMLEELNGK